MPKRSGYVRQRRGELDHHAAFAENPIAYLIWNRLRLLAHWRSGLVESSARLLAETLNISLRSVQSWLSWLQDPAQPPCRNGRSQYLELMQKGNQWRDSIYLICKHEACYHYSTERYSASASGCNSTSNSPESASASGCNSKRSAPTSGCVSTSPNANDPNELHAPKKYKRRIRKTSESNVIQGQYDRAAGLYAGEKRAMRRGRRYDATGRQPEPTISLAELVERAKRNDSDEK